MSLINKVLQDLDSRRPEVTGSGTYGSQVRVVPGRRRIHAAWWIAMGLGALLVGVIAWLLPSSMSAKKAAHADSGPRPVKIAGDVNIAKPVPVSVAAPMPANQEKNEIPAVPAASSVSTNVDVPKPVNPQPQEKKHIDVEASASAPKKTAAIAKAAPANKPSASEAVSVTKVKEAVAAPLPEKKAPPAKVAAVPTMSSFDGGVVPVSVNKQVKALNAQQRAENEYRKALLLIQQGKTSEGVAGLEQVLQLDANHAAARQALIGALLDTSRQDDAALRAREGLDLDPAQPGLAMILSRLQLEKGELRPAIDTLQRSLRYAADRADYQAFLAALLQRDARNKEAVDHYLQALRQSPQSGVWWMGLGISLQAENRLPEAQEAFSRAKSTNSLSAELLAFVESKLKQLQH